MDECLIQYYDALFVVKYDAWYGSLFGIWNKFRLDLKFVWQKIVQNCKQSWGLLISCIVVMYSFDHTLTLPWSHGWIKYLKTWTWNWQKILLILIQCLNFISRIGPIFIFFHAIELLRQSFVLIFIFFSLNTIIRANFVDNKSYFLSFSK